MGLVRQAPMRRSAPLLAAFLLLSGCSDQRDRPSPPRLPAAVPIGTGPLHRPAALTRATRRGAPVGRLRCTRGDAPRFGVHVEVFGRRRTVIVPAGIGVAPPWRGRAPYVRAGRCSYPVRTREPTGVVEVARGQPATLGDLFELWGQPLGARRVASFRGRTRVWVDGRRWRADPRSVPLTRHAQVVLSDDARVPVHARYSFPPGL
jgi:hypothetical protein